MRVLFSPIGNTDPWRYNYDGAMLHIVRHYQPEKVVLFFTQSLWDDGHGKYPWAEIVRQVSGDKTAVEIIREEVERPHDFDAFKELFHKYVTKTEKENPEAEILLNITSGTPQMETTLCLEFITDPIGKKVVQVATPIKGSNVDRPHTTPEDWEIDILIVNEEERQAASRCSEPDLLFFKEVSLKARLVQLLESYDYPAAYGLISGKEGRLLRLHEEARVLMDHAYYRSLNDKRYERVIRDRKDLQAELLPLRNKEEVLRNILEHFLTLQIEVAQDKVSAALIHTMPIAEAAAIYYFMKNHKDAFTQESLSDYSKTGKNPMPSGKIIKYINDKGVYSGNYTPSKNGLALEQLVFTAEYFARGGAKKDKRIHELLAKIDKVRRDRNSAAHSIRLIDASKIDGRKICAALKELIISATPIEGEHCNLFDRINEMITEKLFQ